MTSWRLSIFLVLLGCTPKVTDVVMPVADASLPDSGVVVVDAGPTCGCERWGVPHDAGVIESPLVELSGLVASRSQPGIFYAHNDSGDSARFFGLNDHGQILEKFTLASVDAVDWEDIGLGPCGTGTCVFLADIGDNRFVRDDYVVYMVNEPTVTSGTAPLPWERLRFEYPGGEHHNAESLFVHPKTGRPYIITKEDGAVSEVYRFPLPLDPAHRVTLERVTALTIPGTGDRPVTGADVNVCGTAVLVRMYNRLVEYRLPPTETEFERVFARDPITVPVADEPQGEAVAYGADGVSYFTSSEKLVDPPPLYEVRCR